MMMMQIMMMKIILQIRSFESLTHLLLIKLTNVQYRQKQLTKAVVDQLPSIVTAINALYVGMISRGIKQLRFL